MAPVAVGEWMDRNEPVMELDAHAVSPTVIPHCVAPELRVVDQVPDSLRDLVIVHTDVRGSHAVPTGPSPYVTEHLPMETTEETVVENLAGRSRAAGRPEVASTDVGLFGRVQLTPCTDVRQPQLTDVVVVDQGLSTITAIPALTAQSTTRTTSAENR